MGLGLGGCREAGSKVINWKYHAVSSFLLGAALPTLLLFVLASDRVGEQLSTISTWGNTGHGAAPASQEQEEKFPGLAELLPKVAMDDRTVIMTLVNEAWAWPGSLFDLYRDGFKYGEDIEHLLAHVLIVALDPAGFHHCTAVHPHCYLLQVKGMDLGSAKVFMSKDYLELVWARLSLLQRVLELGYNVLFTDCDMIWFRNPFRHIAVYADMSVSSDDFSAARVPLDNPLNMGFYFVKGTSRSVEMLKYWQAARPRFPNDHDQSVFSRIKHELVAKFQAKIEPLETVYFGGFCEYHDDLDKTCTMHANCCIGLDNKVHDLRDIAADWNKYRRLPPEEKKRGNFTWTVPAGCRRSSAWRKPVQP